MLEQIWYQIDPNSFTVRQQGLVQQAGYHFYAPATAANGQGDAVLAYNSSGTDHSVGIYTTGRYHTDPPNTLQGILRVKSGEGCYERNNSQNTVSFNSEVTIDPIDVSLFWFHTGYLYGGAASCQNDDWATGVAAMQFAGPSVTSNGALRWQSKRASRRGEGVCAAPLPAPRS